MIKGTNNRKLEDILVQIILFSQNYFKEEKIVSLCLLFFLIIFINLKLEHCYFSKMYNAFVLYG